MLARRASSTLALCSAIAALALVGCSGAGGSSTAGSNSAASSNGAQSSSGAENSSSTAGSDAAVCEVLTSDTSLSSTVFAAIIPGMTDRTRIEAQNDLLAQIKQPPADLADEWATWLDYREFATANLETDPGAIVTKYTEIADAGDALSDFYTSTCL